MGKERGKVWLGAAGIVMNGNGEWLVVKKTYGGLKGKWSFPAGFVEPGERADEAAIREVAEETGIRTELSGMAGFRTGVLKGEISDNMALFLLRPLSDSQPVIPQEREIAEARWMTPHELSDSPDSSLLIHEIAGEAVDGGLPEVRGAWPGDIFGYTSYKFFFRKGGAGPDF
ncbi:Phosphatase nudJ [Bhargavaea cecembensis DSE10]|uniref:Phosphatase nudJ n=1 Tax=Bhargavaea cecembensis DSE10 TaxID=1235279 RepID=M7P3M1_9BACL|nr:NUDIX domain-containing protein [Bhargavaea cecembensis]EMR05139.1 Phosphatase nudJ [Bhargavaea cecembensis DSE10]